MRTTALFTQPPCHVLIGQPLAALDRVHEMPLDRVAAAQRHVIAALNHPRAAALADQTFHRDGDLGPFRCRLLCMERRKQPRTPGAEDQDIRVVTFDIAGASCQIACKKNIALQ